jgi:hypothetical protein
MPRSKVAPKVKYTLTPIQLDSAYWGGYNLPMSNKT